MNFPPSGERDELNPAARLALIAEQRRRAGSQLGPDLALIYAVWGVALLIGEGSFFLSVWDGPVRLPLWLAGVLLALLLTGAGVSMGLHVATRVLGVRGSSARQGRYYGWCWTIGFVALSLVINGVARGGAPTATVGALWASGSALVIGLLYMAGGALWQDRGQFWLGVWFAVIAGTAGLLGSPWAFLVLSVAGGGGLLLASGVALALRHRRRAARWSAGTGR